MVVFLLRIKDVVFLLECMKVVNLHLKLFIQYCTLVVNLKNQDTKYLVVFMALVLVLLMLYQNGLKSWSIKIVKFIKFVLKMVDTQSNLYM